MKAKEPTDPDAIDAIIRERESVVATAAKAKPMGTHGGKREGAGVRKVEEPKPPVVRVEPVLAEPIQGSVRTLIKRGANSGYQVARIARDDPDTIEAMKRGEYPSVRAAAKA